jgi:hypothetical protein
MTPERAEEIARDPAPAGYDGHPAAAALILEAIHGATEDRRRRSALALAWLDPWPGADPPLPLAASPVEGPARAVADLLLFVVYSTDREERRRVARLLSALCAEASRIARRRAAA